MGKMKVLVILFFAIILFGGGAMFFLKEEVMGKENEKEKEISAEELVEMSVDTDVITTNLASANNFAIVQFNILLSSKETKEEAEKRKPEVRAAIISTVAGFTKDELIGKEGIVKLEKELSTKLESIVETGEVERVLVTEFKLQ
ncbi:flagellar basal body-associated FliL family protein [Paenisporosarcina sp. FSL H8-0542]|uniref:flagellar basal body-associated FliL family protein n=1 Tax=Paenisporosarcina sp. FSL H8-0542 TaxID=2921401 RepID=UPI00315B2B2C